MNNPCITCSLRFESCVGCVKRDAYRNELNNAMAKAEAQVLEPVTLTEKIAYAIHRLVHRFLERHNN